MARQHDSKLVGTVNNLIFYNFRGQYYMRAKPACVKRTKASVRSGLNFGKASKTGRQIRDIIQPINPCISDKRMIFRFTGALNKYISWKGKQDPGSLVRKKELPFVSGFQFNDQADLESITAINVSVKSAEPGFVEIRLAPLVPAEALHAPFNTDHIQLKIILTTTNLADVETVKLGMSEIDIPYNKEIFQSPVISMVVGSKSGGLLIAVLAVQYMVTKKNRIEKVTDLRKLPCGVVWAGIL